MRCSEINFGVVEGIDTATTELLSSLVYRAWCTTEGLSDPAEETTDETAIDLLKFSIAQLLNKFSCVVVGSCHDFVWCEVVFLCGT